MPLIVGVNGLPAGSAVDGVFANAGIKYARVDIGWDGNLQDGLANLKTLLGEGFTPLPLYELSNEGDGNCKGQSPQDMAGDLTNTVLPALKADGLHWLELCNESYATEDATTYADQEDAAHKAVEAFDQANNYNITLIAVDSPTDSTWIPDVLTEVAKDESAGSTSQAGAVTVFISPKICSRLSLARIGPATGRPASLLLM